MFAILIFYQVTFSLKELITMVEYRTLDLGKNHKIMMPLDADKIKEQVLSLFVPMLVVMTMRSFVSYSRIWGLGRQSITHTSENVTQYCLVK